MPTDITNNVDWTGKGISVRRLTKFGEEFKAELDKIYLGPTTTTLEASKSITLVTDGGNGLQLKDKASSSTKPAVKLKSANDIELEVGPSGKVYITRNGTSVVIPLITYANGTLTITTY